jgi:hypothetical protein
MTIERIRKANHLYEIEVRRASNLAVEQGGGVWKGIQEPNLALFNSPKTGTTLALKTSEITPELVRSKIQRSDAQFARHKS